MFCENCGTKIEDNGLFCPNCGKRQDKINKVELERETSSKSKKKKISKKIIPILILVILSVVVVAALFIFPRIKGILKKETDTVICYIKDDELYANSSSDLLSQKLTKKMLLNDSDIRTNIISYWFIYPNIQFCPESYRIYFPDRIEGDGENIYEFINDSRLSLYYVDLKQVKGEGFTAERVDSKVKNGYQISRDGTRIYYKDVDDGCLYVNDLVSKTKIAENVGDYYVDQNNDFVIYYTTNSEYSASSLYVYEQAGNSREIASDIRTVYCADDYSLICYQQENTIFALYDGTTIKEVFTIENEDTYIDDVLYDEGQDVFYFSTNVYYSSNKYPKATDYINDDLLEQDVAIVAPDSTDKKYWKSWTVQKRGDKIINEYATELNEEYYEQLTLYKEKLKRDKIREEAKGGELYVSNQTLYYFDGTQSKKICSDAAGNAYVDGGILFFDRLRIEETEKVNFSEICSSVEDVNITAVCNYVKGKMDENTVYCAAINGNLVEMAKGSDISAVRIDADNNAIYYISGTEDELSGDLYKVEINGNKLSEPTPIYSMVKSYAIINGDVIYYRDPILVDVENSKVECDLYINETKIDSGVIGSALGNYLDVSYLPDGTIFYQSNYATNTLKQFDGEEIRIIASDVMSYVPVAKDKVYFIDDYDINTYTGELKYLDDEMVVKIATDVSSIFDVTQNSVRY